MGNEVNDTISDLKKREGEFLNIDGNPVYEGEYMFQQNIYLYVLYIYFNEIYMDMLEYK